MKKVDFSSRKKMKEVVYPKFLWDESGKSYRRITNHFPLVYELLSVSIPKRKEFVFEREGIDFCFIFETKKSFENRKPIGSEKLFNGNRLYLGASTHKQKKRRLWRNDNHSQDG